MNEHAGPACALSGLIVALFAVLLHDKVPPPAPPRATPSSRPAPPVAPRDEARAVLTPAKVEASAPPSPRPIPVVERLTTLVTQGVSAPPSVAPTEPPRSSRVEAPPAPSAPEPHIAVPKRSELPSPRPRFAVVGPGESLSDVATRIYGSKDAAETLWKANRDQVERADSPLVLGTLLRTP